MWCIIKMLSIVLIGCALVMAGCKSRRPAAPDAQVPRPEGLSQVARQPIVEDTPAEARATRKLTQEELLAQCMPSAVNIRIFNYLHSGVFCGGGAVLHESGYILAGAHVFLAADGGVPLVYFDEENYVPARVVGMAADADLCIVKIIFTRTLSSVKLGQADSIRPGDKVLAVGQPEGELSRWTTAIVDSLEIDGAPRILVTRSGIDRGYSGGPLFGPRGDLVGLINVISQENRGVAAAVRTDYMRETLAEEFGDESDYAFALGMTLDETGPPIVVALAADGPAAQAGVQVGDTVGRVGQMRVDDVVHYYLAMLDMKSASPVDVAIERDGEAMTLTITPAARPMAKAAEVPGELTPGLRMRVSRQPWGAVRRFESVGEAETSIVDTVSDDHLGDYYGPGDGSVRWLHPRTAGWRVYLWRSGSRGRDGDCGWPGGGA